MRPETQRNAWATWIHVATTALSIATFSVSAYAQSTSGAATPNESASSQTGIKDGSAGSAGTTAGNSASKTAGGTLSKIDRDFMRELALTNIAEIETAKLAQSRSKNELVRSFAQKMVDDHTRAQDELSQLAQSKGMQLPTGPDRKYQATVKKMTALTDEQFDRQYMAQAGLKDHREAHRLVQRISTRAKDPELRAYVEKISSAIQDHLKSAQDMRGAKQETSGK